MNERIGPLLTLQVCEQMQDARQAGAASVECSLDLDRSRVQVALSSEAWTISGRTFPYPAVCKDRTIYHWSAGAAAFEPLSRFTQSLVKLVPTEWGAPTFEIDGIKMLPTAQVSPFQDAARKVGLVQPKGRTVLDTCGGMGYFAHWCLHEGAAKVISFEKNADVLWLRAHNPWSPEESARLVLSQADISHAIAGLPDASVDACLHDPPRFGIAGELYSQSFYDQLARVMRPQARLFHYTGTPNKLTSGRDVPREVSARLQRAGFTTALEGDGVLARRVAPGRTGRAR